MVEADSHLKLLQSSILVIYKVFELIDIWVHGSSLKQLYPHTWLKFGGSESLVESKCCQFVLIETESHLKLLPSSILDVYKVFEHIDMLSMGIQ